MSCINPGVLAALVKCLYLLVCLPAKKENIAIEETFQEPLAKVSCGKNILHLYSSFFLITQDDLVYPRFPSHSELATCFSPGSSSALSTASQCGETCGNPGVAVSYHWPHITVGPDQHLLEASGLPGPQGSLCCSNKQHCPELAR